MRILPLLLVTSVACAPPVDAPSDFESLCAFIFEHAEDEEPEAMQDGVVNLQSWLDINREKIGEGYVVKSLDEGFVERFEEQAWDLTNLVGVAYATQYEYTMDQILETIIKDDENEPRYDEEGRLTYRRTFNSDRECFLERRCDTLQYEIETIDSFAMNIEATMHYVANIVRFETEWGTAVVWRNWQLKPIAFNWDWIRFDLSYYLGVLVEIEPGLVERTEATWVLGEFANAPLPMDVALSMGVDTLIESTEELRDELAEAYP